MQTIQKIIPLIGKTIAYTTKQAKNATKSSMDLALSIPKALLNPIFEKLREQQELRELRKRETETITITYDNRPEDPRKKKYNAFYLKGGIANSDLLNLRPSQFWSSNSNVYMD